MKNPTSRWAVGIFLIGAIVGIGASALGATDAVIPESMQSADEGTEALMVLLERKERTLERRASTLEARGADLRAAEEQVEARLAELKSLRDEIREMLVDLDEERETRVVGLVKMFESMRPPQAALIIAETEDAVALEVLERMNAGKAGKVLAQMPATRAARLAQFLGAPALPRDVP
jgi:flagellar motility protein MotE (MotC chaperone)